MFSAYWALHPYAPFHRRRPGHALGGSATPSAAPAFRTQPLSTQHRPELPQGVSSLAASLPGSMPSPTGATSPPGPTSHGTPRQHAVGSLGDVHSSLTAEPSSRAAANLGPSSGPTSGTSALPFHPAMASPPGLLFSRPQYAAAPPTSGGRRYIGHEDSLDRFSSEAATRGLPSLHANQLQSPSFAPAHPAFTQAPCDSSIYLDGSPAYMYSPKAAPQANVPVPAVAAAQSQTPQQPIPLPPGTLLIQHASSPQLPSRMGGPRMVGGQISYVAGHTAKAAALAARSGAGVASCFVW